MIRDILVFPLDQENELVVAADNSGAIGNKESDAVRVPYETVSYYSFRVAAMECLAAGGQPFAAVIHNFSGEDAWDELCAGIRKAAEEIGVQNVPITGSTESNFQMMQSATGIVVLGKRLRKQSAKLPEALCYAVIGRPLVGLEILEQEEHIAPLALFRNILELKGIHTVLPVGSKGILPELRNILDREELPSEDVVCELPLEKTAGPSTCFLVAYEAEAEERLIETGGRLYFKVGILG